MKRMAQGHTITNLHLRGVVEKSTIIQEARRQNMQRQDACARMLLRHRHGY